jgi:hypothetical protein
MNSRSHLTRAEKSIIIAMLLLLIGYIGSYAVVRQSPVFSVENNLLLVAIILPVLFLGSIKNAAQSLIRRRQPFLREDSSDISVIVLHHRGHQSLRQTLDNLVRRFNTERIIVTTDSTDTDTADIAASYGVTVLQWYTRQKQSDVIRQALARIMTSSVLILSDDIFIGDAVIPTNLLEKGYSGILFQLVPKYRNYLTKLIAFDYKKTLASHHDVLVDAATGQLLTQTIGLFSRNELIREILFHGDEFTGDGFQNDIIAHLSERNKGIIRVTSSVKTMVPDTVSGLFRERAFVWYPQFIALLTQQCRMFFRRNVPMRVRTQAIYSLFTVTVIDFLRLLIIPVLLFTPVLLLVTYGIAVVLETVTYLAADRKNPLWILLVSPLYTLGMISSRIVGMMGVVVNQLNGFILHERAITHGKTTAFFKQIYSTGLVIFGIGMLLSFYSYLLIIPGKSHPSVLPPVNRIPVAVESPVPTKTRVVESISKAKDEKIYNYTVVSGDSYARLVKRAVKEFSAEHDLALSVRELHYAVYVIESGIERKPLHPGDDFSISEKTINDVLLPIKP